jgi:hypothetical protein
MALVWLAVGAELLLAGMLAHPAELLLAPQSVRLCQLLERR